MFAGFPQRIFYLVTGTGPPCTTVYLPATPPDSAELANNASFIVSFSRGETGSILNEMKRQENAAAWFLKNKPPDQSASSGFVVSSTSILKLLISLIRWATPYQVSCTSVLRVVTSVMAAGWRDYDRRLSVCLCPLCERNSGLRGFAVSWGSLYVSILFYF